MKFSRTSQRRVILSELRKLKSHPTADDLYTIVREKLPQISLGTVYRNLDQMAAAGIIQKLELSGRQKRFDGNVEKHYHMRCPHCGAVKDVENERLADVENILSDVLDELGADSFWIEFTGHCKDCNKAEAGLV
ncbi:transcriptional repressor [Lentisphaerota bacterium ZTH]|nr:transcriptional repressor [Lentisphaerota bacterium]WET06295.1 transcriptional repressor [Lentisphaerota bacterium ZTH]